MNTKSKTSKKKFNLNLIPMKKLLLYSLFAFAILLSPSVMAQQGIGTNTPDKSSAVDIVSTKRGLLIPRIALTATNVASPVTAPANSLLVYNTTPDNGDVSPGFYYWDGDNDVWVRFIDTDSQHTTTVVSGQGIVVTPDTTDPNNTEYTVSVAPGASEQTVLVTIENPDYPGDSDDEFITTWVSYADFLEDLLENSVENGLYYDETSGTIKLGGDLTEETTIATGENDLIFNVDENGSIVITGDGLEAMDPEDVPAGATVAVMLADGTLQTYDLATLIADLTITADNGLTMTDNNIQLGGELITPTTIVTGTDGEGDPDTNNTLAITNLEAAAAANEIVVTDADTGILRTVKRSISHPTAGALSVSAIPDYSPYVQEVNVAVTLAAAEYAVTLPAPSDDNRGQVVNIKIMNETDAHDGLLNIVVDGGGTLTYGAMPYQGWIVKSNGTAWVIVGRN